jgi:hypothetical protein
MASTTVGTFAAARRSSRWPIAAWYGVSSMSKRCRRSASDRSWLPGTGTPALAAGIDPGTPGGRLQSTTRRE